ncbi:MAG TPA: PH domain-containing protein [Bryobacteraceae bacterium]|nr:PH domain-containing protein [Bryobacteraceae bacterium]
MDDFSVSYDRTTKIVSAIACVLLAIPAATIHNIGVRIVSILVMLVSYAYSPRSYGFADGSIVVKRLIGSVRVPLAGLQEARPATKDDFSGCVRLWGSGGLFGYYGWFQTSKLGRCKWYVTDRSKAVVVRTGAQTILFSPDEGDRFLECIRAVSTVPATVADQPLAATLRSVSSPNWAGRTVAATVAVVVASAAALTFLYAPGPPAYSLTPDALTIHDRFYPVTLPADRVDVDHIRVVDFTNDHEWQPTLRTNGFATLHYHSGWFRVASGQTVRMYRADSRRLVLLPPKGDGAPVLYEVKDPDEFVRSLRQEWAGRS